MRTLGPDPEIGAAPASALPAARRIPASTPAVHPNASDCSLRPTEERFPPPDLVTVPQRCGRIAATPFPPAELR